MTAPADRITVEGAPGAFDRFERLTLVQSITAPAELVMETGDLASFGALASAFALGAPWRVYLNGRLRFQGRVYDVDETLSADGGTTSVMIRSRFHDAHYASADPAIRLVGASVAQFIAALYAPLGYTAADIVIAPGADRDIMTGRSAAGAAPAVPLEPLRGEQSKVNPPETIQAAAERILKRLGLMHWETPDGKLYVGKPDDAQQPLYLFRCEVGSPGNNVTSVKRARQGSDVPSEVRVFGQTTDRDGTNPQRFTVTEAVPGMSWSYRPVILPAEGARTRAAAQAQAKRERAQRMRRLDALDVALDRWSYWNGTEAIPLAPNTTAEVKAGLLGLLDRYYVERVQFTLSADASTSTSLSLVAPGTWEV